MSENLKLWNALSKTDPKHTKGFKRAGGFSGTAVAPIYMTQKMTEQFGPAGQGWGMGEPSFQTVSAPEGEVLVYCTASVWWRDSDGQCVVYGVGGDKVVGKNKYGLFADDEAFKKAYTDALSNAMKQLGMAADIHMGLYDDNKYVNSLKEEFASKSKPDAPIPSGALTKTAARQAMMEFSRLIHSDEDTPDAQMLDAHVKDHKDLIEQVMRDWPDWWFGKQGVGDGKGAEHRIQERRDALNQREEDPDNLAKYAAA